MRVIRVFGLQCHVSFCIILNDALEVIDGDKILNIQSYNYACNNFHCRPYLNLGIVIFYYILNCLFIGIWTQPLWIKVILSCMDLLNLEPFNLLETHLRINKLICKHECLNRREMYLVPYINE